MSMKYRIANTFAAFAGTAMAYAITTALASLAFWFFVSDKTFGSVESIVGGLLMIGVGNVVGAPISAAWKAWKEME